MHGENGKGFGGRCLLSCDQSWQRARRSVSQDGGLHRLPRSDGGGSRAIAVAAAGLVFDTEPFSFGVVAAWGWGSEPMDAMVADFARASIPSPLPLQRTRLARAFQSVSNRGGRALVDGSPLRGAERLACQPCRPCGGLALVLCGIAGRRETRGNAGCRAGPAERGLAGLGQPATKRGGIGGVTEVHRAWHALWKRVVAARHGRAIGAGSESSSAWSSSPIDDKVECPLLPLQSEVELAALRKCIERGTPYGSESWQHATAERLGLEASLHPRGRPRQSTIK